MKESVSYEAAHAAAQDEGDRSMRRAGRTAWSREDYDAAARTFNRLRPVEAETAEAGEGEGA